MNNFCEFLKQAVRHKRFVHKNDRQERLQKRPSALVQRHIVIEPDDPTQTSQHKPTNLNETIQMNQLQVSQKKLLKLIGHFSPPKLSKRFSGQKLGTQDDVKHILSMSLLLRRKRH